MCGHVSWVGRLHITHKQYRYCQGKGRRGKVGRKLLLAKTNQDEMEMEMEMETAHDYQARAVKRTWQRRAVGWVPGHHQIQGISSAQGPTDQPTTLPHRVACGFSYRACDLTNEPSVPRKAAYCLVLILYYLLLSSSSCSRASSIAAHSEQTYTSRSLHLLV